MADNQIQALKSWFERQAEKEAKNDVLKRSDRIGNLIGIIGIIVVLIFFIAHSTSQSGFFTPEFGAVAAFIFFGSSAWGIIPSMIRFITGKKSPSKPFDLFGSIFVLIAMLYFLASFSFDFSHVAAPLPDFLKWTIQWLTDGFVRALMVLATIVLVFVIPFQIFSYQNLRCALAKQAPVPARIADAAEKAEEPKQ